MRSLPFRIRTEMVNVNSIQSLFKETVGVKCVPCLGNLVSQDRQGNFVQTCLDLPGLCGD